MLYGSVNLFGRVGAISELKDTANKSKLLSFSLAEDIFRKGQKVGEKVETVWHQIKVWGDKAIKINELIRKGEEVFISGMLRYHDNRAYVEAINVKSMRHYKMLVSWDEKDNFTFDARPLEKKENKVTTDTIQF